MATARQIEANRRNASGPHQMTEAGQQAVRGNAIRHGLAAKAHIVLPGEDRNFYNEILQSLRAEYAPATTQQEILVQEIAQNYWRLMRARNMETGSLLSVEQNFARMYQVDSCPADDLTRSAQLATAFANNGKLFDKISRYQTAAERSYYRAIRELQKLKSSQPQAVTAPQVQTDLPEPAPPPQPKTEFRSVPQNRPNPTQRDMEQANMRMSDAEFDAFLGEITAPPRLNPH